jgi:signal transduction histidine kinase
METEITSIPELAPGTQSYVELHSLVNVLSVLHAELVILGIKLANDPDLLKESLASCQRTLRSFTETENAIFFAHDVKSEEIRIVREINSVAQKAVNAESREAVAESLENIESIFQVLEVRAAETLARIRAPGKWIDYPIEELRRDFVAVFSAIEKNSHGRYHIIYNLAQQQPADYYVDFVVESTNGVSVAMPILFKDVMRDLIANARKYTEPGGTLNVGLHETDSELRFAVQDTGCGIPPSEIPEVVYYGKRGSNVTHKHTMGGGFGLTKAFLVTKRFGGRMWLKSELGIGTRVRIVLPRQGATGNPR